MSRWSRKRARSPSSNDSVNAKYRRVNYYTIASLTLLAILSADKRNFPSRIGNYLSPLLEDGSIFSRCAAVRSAVGRNPFPTNLQSTGSFPRGWKTMRRTILQHSFHFPIYCPSSSIVRNRCATRLNKTASRLEREFHKKLFPLLGYIDLKLGLMNDSWSRCTLVSAGRMIFTPGSAK